MNEPEFTHDAQASGAPAQPSSPAPFPQDRVDQMARLAAASSSDQSASLEHAIRSAVEASEAGERTRIQHELARNDEQMNWHRRQLRESERRLDSTEETVTTGRRKPMGWLGVLAHIIGGVGLASALAAEIYGASILLRDTGALQIDSIEKGIIIIVTAVTVGFTFKLGYHLLTRRWRGRAVAMAFIAVLAFFALYALGFAIEAHKGVQQADASLSVMDGAGGFGAFAANLNPASGSWLMFLSLLALMPFTSFLGSLGLRKHLELYEVFQPNPGLLTAVQQRDFQRLSMEALKVQRANLETALSGRLAHEEDAVSFGRLRFTAWKAHAAGLSPEPPPVGPAAPPVDPRA